MRACSRTLLASLLLSVGLASSGLAAEEPPRRTTCPICRSAADNPTVDYRTKAAHTLMRGATNTLFGWTEIIRQPADEVKDGGNVFLGILKGIGQGVGRTMAGAGEVLTFWTPKDKDSYLHFSTDCPICAKKALTEHAH